MRNWDDIRIFLAVARNGSITAGARNLGLDQSTVSRRLQGFEDKIGQSLFVGTAKRNTLSPAGREIFEGALRLEREVEEVGRRVAAHSEESGGTLHVVTTDFLSNHLLLSVTSEFLRQHRDINLRVKTQSLDKEHLDGDVALLATNDPMEDLYGRKLATATFASYASPSYLKAHKGRLEEMVWLNWDDGSDTPSWPALAPEIPDRMCRLRCDSVASLLEATRLGVGATILPCFIGEKDPGLERIMPNQVVSRRDIWLLVRADLRRVLRIRTFLDFFVRYIKTQRATIESH